MSYTFTLTGRESLLDAYIHPPIVLKEEEEYVIALINFESFNSIPNIDESNNKFYLANDLKHPIEVPIGSYEIDDISNYLQQQLQKKGVSLSIFGDNNTLKTRIKCDHLIDFTPIDSLASVLGFENKPLKSYEATSENPADILKVNAICITCNLVSGSYLNNREVHIIHQLFPNVPPGAKIVENPTNLIYLPVTTRVIDYISLQIVDQDGNLVNFRKERITVRLHLKKLS